MNKQFTCAVSMVIPSEEQFNKDLRQHLIDLGYRIEDLGSFTKSKYLVTNLQNIIGVVSYAYIDSIHNKTRHLIEPYNPKLFLALASLTTESAETKEEVLARFEKGEERELIGYRFRSDDFNRMTRSLYNNNKSPYKLFDGLIHLAPNCNAVTKLTELNLLDTFCEPVYKEIETISIEEAETILRSIGRNEKIKA